MSKDTIITTENLQKRFPQVYEEFFLHNDLVLSLPLTIYLPKDISYTMGGISIRQSMPFRFYVGISLEGSKNKLRFGSNMFYNALSDKFETYFEKDSEIDRYLQYSQEYIKKNIQSEFPGLTFNFLFENSINCSFDACVVLGIFSAAMVYFNKLSVDQVNALGDLSSQEIKADKTELSQQFNFLMHETMKMNSLEYLGIVTGNHTYAAIVNSKFPIVYFTEERQGSIEHPYKNLFPQQIDENNLDQLEQVKWWGFRLNEIANISGFFPLDMVNVRIVDHRNFDAFYEYVHRYLDDEFGYLKKFMTSSFKTIRENNEENRLPFFLKNLDLEKNYQHEFLKGLAYHTMIYLRDMINVYKNKVSTNEANRFLTTINKSVHINGSIEEQPSSHLMSQMERFFQKARKKGVQIAIRPDNFGRMDGNLFVFAPRGRFRQEIFEIVEQLKKYYNQDVCVDFCSWRDGWGAEGQKVEQFVSQDYFSDFVDKDALVLTVWQTTKSTLLVKDSDISKKDYDLLVDTINNKIYIKGKEFGSREIPSQKATIKLLSYLLDNQRKPINNQDLPESSYAKYRNELSGKIVSPLNKLVHQHLNKDLGIRISGKLVNYQVEFDPHNLKIGKIERI